MISRKDAQPLTKEQIYKKPKIKKKSKAKKKIRKK